MAQPIPVSNLLLASLPREDYALLKPHLAEVQLEQKAVVKEPGGPVTHAYFPLRGMISLLATFETGEAIEIAAIGREGAIGAKVGLHPPLAFARAIVLLPGTALKIDVLKFQQAAMKSPAITHLATCANDVMTANLQQSAACNALHGLEARLARWLLHAHDRHDSDKLPLTQEFLSQMLGVRRTTVSVAAKALQKAGLVRYRRANIEIDRAGLEALSCECYGAVRRNVELILQSFSAVGQGPADAR